MPTTSAPDDGTHEGAVEMEASTEVRPRRENGGARRGACPPPLAPGAEVDCFTVLSPIGRGGMGRVYLARDRNLGRLVALKVIGRSALSDEDLRARFLLEARLTARFNHPHIVTIHSVGEHEGRPYLALEYLEGQTLAQRLRAGPIRSREALRIGRAVAEALAEAHRQGVLHRDLKPENVFLPNDSRVRVLDFGLAVASQGALPEAPERPRPPVDGEVDDESPTLPFVGSDAEGPGLAGTPLYIAPELWLGEPVTAASDVWALGVILHEMLSGERPFRARSVDELRTALCSGDAVPRIRRPAVPDAAAGLAACCLDKLPERRPSAAEIAATLRAVVARRARARRGGPSSAPFLPRSGRPGSAGGGRRSQALA